MMQFSRRRVIKTLFLGTSFSSVLGRSWSNPLLFEVHAAASNQDGLLRVNLADFPQLGQARGSVRISTSALDANTNKQLGLFPPVMINRGDASEFYVMNAACTHEECIVRRLDKTSNLMVCPCHGSQYKADGTVVHGPALQSLQRYNFARDGNTLNIEIPDLFYEMTVEKAGTAPRLKISFIAFESLTYELYFRQTLDAPPQRVAFATSEAGPIDQTELQVPGDFAFLFVERPAKYGFFQVAMKTMVV